jgi:hypothetical protein
MSAVDIFNNNRELLYSYALGYGREVNSAFEELNAAAVNNDEPGVIKAANNMWFALPDNPGIHGEAFYVLCDIAEMIFG